MRIAADRFNLKNITVNVTVVPEGVKRIIFRPRSGAHCRWSCPLHQSHAFCGGVTKASGRGDCRMPYAVELACVRTESERRHSVCDTHGGFLDSLNSSAEIRNAQPTIRFPLGHGAKRTKHEDQFHPTHSQLETMDDRSNVRHPHNGECSSSEPIRQHPHNGHYFLFRQKPVVLI